MTPTTRTTPPRPRPDQSPPPSAPPSATIRQAPADGNATTERVPAHTRIARPSSLLYSSRTFLAEHRGDSRRGAVGMAGDGQHEQSETEVWIARSGVQGFSPAAFRRQRSRRQLSLSELSLLSGVSAATISAWETGKVAPSPRNLAAAAEMLGIGVADLVPVKEDRLVLANLRHQVGLTQQAAAEAVGLKRSMYGAIESGLRAADQEQRIQLAQLYGVSENLFGILWQRTRDARIARLQAR